MSGEQTLVRQALSLIAPHQARIETMGENPSEEDRLAAIAALAADLPAYNAVLIGLGAEPVEIRYPDHAAFRHICLLMDMAYALKPYAE